MQMCEALSLIIVTYKESLNLKKLVFIKNYFQIGACRHGDKCSRTHHQPQFSQTVLLKNFYHNPVVDVRQADAYDSKNIDLLIPISN